MSNKFNYMHSDREKPTRNEKTNSDNDCVQLINIYQLQTCKELPMSLHFCPLKASGQKARWCSMHLQSLLLRRLGQEDHLNQELRASLGKWSTALLKRATLFRRQTEELRLYFKSFQHSNSKRMINTYPFSQRRTNSGSNFWLSLIKYFTMAHGTRLSIPGFLPFFWGRVVVKGDWTQGLVLAARHLRTYYLSAIQFYTSTSVHI
jgi:hypothetical protein